MTAPYAKSLSPSSASRGSLVGLIALAGVALAVMIYILLHFAETRELQEQDTLRGKQNLELARAGLESTWENAVFVAEQIARQLNATGKSNVADLLAQYRDLWPGSGLSIYSGKGEIINLAGANGAASSAPLPHTVREMIYKALTGELSKDFSLYRGFLSLSVAVPVIGPLGIRVLVFSVPMDIHALRAVGSGGHAEVAVLPYEQDRAQPAAELLVYSGDVFIRAIAEVIPSLQRLNSKEGHVFPVLDGRVLVGAAPMRNSGNDIVGVLLAASQTTGKERFPLRHVWLSLAAGLLGVCILIISLKQRDKQVASAIADRFRLLIESDRNKREPDTFEFPFPNERLRSSFQAVSTLVNKYRTQTRKNPPQSAQPTHEDDVCESHSFVEQQYQRLFASLPVGAFQVERSGRLLHVNQAFAQLLGYDSPAKLMSECITFSEFCLYGDEVRNRIVALMDEQSGGRHVVSLRRRDGIVRNFGLVLENGTTAEGDIAPVVEGFLLDLALDERARQAEKERDDADEQRKSLALLLAATARQTRTCLSLPVADFRGQDEKERPSGQQTLSSLPSLPPPTLEEEEEESTERRKGVASVLATLSDIYQIAITEAESIPPVAVPMDFGRFMQRLCRQTMPYLQAKGISLRCEIEEELLIRMNGPAPMLRHALQRALLSVTGPVSEGWACYSVARDPNSPRQPGTSRLLLSASWSACDMTDMPTGPRHAGSNKEKERVVFSMRVSQDEICDNIQPGTLDINAEQSVVAFLARAMNGEMRNCVFSDDLRSIQFVVTLEHLVGVADHILDSGDDVDMPQGTMTTPAPQQDIPVSDFDFGPGDAQNYESVPMPGEHTSLDILMSDDITADENAQDAAHDFRQAITILLVDGGLNDRMLFSLFLRGTPHKVTEAHDGQEGIEAFQRGRYDVIFMDMEMPLMDGYQATRIIRALEADQGLDQTPIVGMTTYALPEFRQQCALAGCTEFLPKPFSRNGLRAMLDAIRQLKQEQHSTA